MSKILKGIKNAEKGSITYHLIEEVAELVKEEYPKKTDIENWYIAQNRINKGVLEEKLAERMFMKNPEIKYDIHLKKAREKVDYISLEEIDKLETEGVSLQKILECNVSSVANRYFHIRGGKDKDSEEVKKAVDDWENAMICVAYKFSLY